MPSEKDLSTVDRLLLRVIQSWRLCRSQYWNSVEGQSKTELDCPSRERNLLPLPPLSVAEALPWYQSKGNVDLLADYENFTIEGINHLYGSPGKRLRKNPSLSQRAAQHKIFDKIERMHVRLNEGDVTFDQKTALKLARLDACDDSPPPASRLIASAFDIKENCGSVNAMRLIPKEHQQTIRSGSYRLVCGRSPQVCLCRTT